MSSLSWLRGSSGCPNKPLAASAYRTGSWLWSIQMLRQHMKCTQMLPRQMRGIVAEISANATIVHHSPGNLMANLSDLVQALANLTEVPEATIFAYGRFAREKGLIAQKGRGRGAAKMELEDAANLLIALGGTAVTREAGDAIRRYRPMCGVIYEFGELECFAKFLMWLAPLGCVATVKDPVNDYKLEANFGGFLEFLIAEAVSGGLMSFMQSIPVAEIPGPLWWEWKRSNSENLDRSVDWLVEHGLAETIPSGKKTLGEHLELRIAFLRTEPPRIEVEFVRYWDHPETIFQISFFPPKHRWTTSALRVSAIFTQDALFGMGLVLADQLAPKSLKSRRRLAGIYERQAAACVVEPDKVIVPERSVRPTLADTLAGIHEADTREPPDHLAEQVGDQIAAEAERYYAESPHAAEIEAKLAEAQRRAPRGARRARGRRAVVGAGGDEPKGDR
jgi:hypothetical protein